MPRPTNVVERLWAETKSEAGEPARGPGEYERVFCYCDDPKANIKSKENPEGRPIYVAVADYIAKHLGMDSVKEAPSYTYTDPEGIERTVFWRGSMGAGSIKVPMMENGEIKKSSKGHKRYLSIPMPEGATIGNISAFLNKEITQNKPRHFISKGGRKYPLAGD